MSDRFFKILVARCGLKWWRRNPVALIAAAGFFASVSCSSFAAGNPVMSAWLELPGMGFGTPQCCSSFRRSKIRHGVCRCLRCVCRFLSRMALMTGRNLSSLDGRGGPACHRSVGAGCSNNFCSVCQCTPYLRQACRLLISPVYTRRRISSHWSTLRNPFAPCAESSNLSGFSRSF